MKKISILFIFFTIIATGFIYRNSFQSYFFQDDWFSFKISQAESLNEIIKFFIPRKDVIYYRPLGIQIPFFLLQKLFSLNPIPFHILTFLTHSINIILVFVLIKLLTGNLKVSHIITFIYAISAVHYIPLYWFSTYSFVLGPMFILLSMILFLNYTLHKSTRLYIASILLFLIGLFANEMVFVTPILLLLVLCYRNKKKLSGWLVPFVVLGIIPFLIRFIYSPPPASGNYEIGIQKSLLNNIEAYLLWSLNWPEEIKNQLINFVTVNPVFILNFKFYYYLFTVATLLILILTVVLPIIFLKKNINLVKGILFGLAWFITGLFPVLFFTRHYFSYYLPISLIGLLLFAIPLFDKFTSEVSKKYKILETVLLIILLSALFLSSIAAVDFNSKVHWVPRRAALSRQLIVKSQYSYWFPKIYISPSAENKLSLNNQDALKIYYNRVDIETIYSPEPEKPKLIGR